MSKNKNNKNPMSRSVALACVQEARKQGCYTRAKSWGGDKTRYDRREGKRVSE
jgi:hypothetical protein